MKPSQPCSSCRGTTFVSATNAKFEIFLNGTYSPRECPTVELWLCTGCGKMDWFADRIKGMKYFADYGKGETVEVNPVPYR